METEMLNLPEEIISNILSRLPVISLCRFRCVSKSWRSLISHPYFIKTHLNRNTNTNNYELLLLIDCADWYTVELVPSQFSIQSVAMHLNLPPDQNAEFCMEICGSCDGLVLMLDESYQCRLVNPSTRESRKLPLSPFSLSPFSSKLRYPYPYSYAYCGLGYDPSILDYKVVIIGYDDKNFDEWSGSFGNAVSVYDLKTNFWRRIENPPYSLPWFRYHPGAFVCGALHWVASNGVDNVIIALDLADEKFRTMHTGFRTMPSPCLARTGVLGGCLCMLVDGPRRLDGWVNLDVWVMKEYGVRDSWTKIVASTCCYIDGPDSWRPLSLSRTGQVLIKQMGYKLVIFDPREKESTELMVHGRPATFEVGTYVESLVSPWRL